MIFGTPDFLFDSLTGEKLQVCVCDAIMPNGSRKRIKILADHLHGYFLMGEDANVYSMTMTGESTLRRLDDGKKIGNTLTAILRPKHVIVVENEREIT